MVVANTREVDREASQGAESDLGRGAGPALKELDLNKTIYDLTEEYPELIDLLKEMGFFGIARPAVRNTLGRVTTLAQGCERQGKDLDEVVATLAKHGFTVGPGV